MFGIKHLKNLYENLKVENKAFKDLFINQISILERELEDLKYQNELLKIDISELNFKNEFIKNSNL